MVKKLRSLELRAFEKIVEPEITQVKPSIITELEDALEPGSVGEFTLNFNENMGLRRAIERWKAKKEKPRLEGKLISYEGKGDGRTYRWAIKRPAET